MRIITRTHIVQSMSLRYCSEMRMVPSSYLVALMAFLAILVQPGLGSVGGGIAPAHAEETITLTTGEYPPYTSESFRYGGVLTRICTEAFALEGVRVKYSYFPWIRSMDALKGKEFVGSLGWRRMPEREEHLLFSDPIMDEDEVFFYRKGILFDWETLDDVGALRIGVTLGYAHIDILEEAVEKKGGRLDKAPNETMSFQKLVRGRVDIVPASPSVGYYILQSEFLPGTAELITHHARPVISGGLHLIVSKDFPGGKKWIDRFNRGLSKLKESGEYDRFIDESLRGEYIPK